MKDTRPARSVDDRGHGLEEVLFYIPRLDHGGPDRVFFELIIGIPPDSVHPVLLANQHSGRFWERLAKTNRSIHSLDVQKRFPLKEFAEFVRRHRIQVVLCTLDSIITASAAKVLYRLDIKVIARPANHLTRNSFELFRKRPFKYGLAWLTNIAAIHLARFVVCQSEDIRRDLRKYWVPQQSMTVIGNPIQLPKEAAKPSEDSRVQIVSLGRLSAQKGYDVLIDAVRLLPSESRNRITVEIYGDGPDREQLRRKIAKQGVGDTVRLKGFTEDTETVLRKAHFFVSSSRYEGFPNAILEALALGVSAIASDCPGGTREIVIPGQTGWLFKPESAVALATCLEEAINSGPYDADMVRRTIRKKSSTEAIVSKYLRVFEEVASA